LTLQWSPHHVSPVCAERGRTETKKIISGAKQDNVARFISHLLAKALFCCTSEG
jgi:hypothetical protein